ncbi:MAG: hypothetical protein HN352_02645 [Bacteroidetes bacterium]|jgi:hypothetical protein|nr:hypothetical protein [Bacteroidota bacterium]MBT3749196.1 hypothetical protein [Bacteroidota bacterium]MBT4399773.1 hypothetical protein [Bacteroidota bacterium]MBT4410324.1 hypothetical protein [Bacteroidota bacterium]MBT7464834.1 hypothetical protein [Bacteroidota bacterium]
MSTGCDNSADRDGSTPMARVYDKFLYSNDLMDIIPTGLVGPDSSEIAKSYIDQWIKKQLLLKHAEFNLEEKNKDFTALIEDYRASLLIYEYKKQMLLDKVDTVVSNNQIEQYYSRNLQSFKLASSVVKALYVRINKSNTKVAEIRQLIGSNNESSFESLVNLCYQYADRFDFFEDEWVSLNQILQKIPDSPENENEFLSSNSLLETQDEEFIHFLQIHEFKRGGETAPVEYVRDKIQDLVRTQRKMEYLQDLEESIYQDAIQKNDFEIFE